MRRKPGKTLSNKLRTARVARRPVARVLVVGNWKMNLNASQSIMLATALSRIPTPKAVDVAVCPSYTSLAEVRMRLRHSGISVGAQDVSWGRPGAFTGEVSAEDLVSLGCRYVIIGHSERRRVCHETDEMVQQKVFTAMGNGLSPILCVGESQAERQRHEQYHIVSQQVHHALSNVPPPRHHQELVVAYEPIWAISPGGPANPSDVNEMARIIHQALVDTYGEQIVRISTRILYGGSVTAGDVRSFVNGDDIRGVLVGRDSLNVSSFGAILKALS
jgi:triosephosphate isomerase (TIM)